MTDQFQIRGPEAVDDLDASVVVDVRDERSYASGHIPGAVNVPYERIRDPGSATAGKLPEPDAFERVCEDAGISPDTDILAYDEREGVYAARFLLTASVFGHKGQLTLLDGGFDTWRSSRETSAETPETERSNYDANGPDERVVDREVVEATVEGEGVLVDTRTPAEYEQSHIPGAVQLGWEELLDGGRLRPNDEIAELLDRKGIDRAGPVVLYCNTARRLSHTYLVLRERGFEDVSFYEGSLTDWVRAESPDWDPEELHERVRELAPRGIEALPRELGDDIFSRLHLVGLYTQKQDGYFMLRTKVPCGRLSAEQAETFGEIATEFATAPEEYGGTEQNPEFGDGFLDVTTRQGLQLHWIELEDVPEIWDRYEEVGLTTVQASGNTLRNVVTCPASGLDGGIDVGPLGESIADRFEGDRELANLPRKLKVSLGGFANSERSEIQDIGFTPAQKGGREGFHVKVGGGLSDGPRAATDLGVFLEPDQLTEFTVAVAELFANHGSYLDTAVNRLRFLVEDWGVERFHNELEGNVDFAFESAGSDLTTDYRADHVGIHEQADGDYYVGLNLPTGRMRGPDLVELAELSRRYGSGEIRTTINQNLLVPNVPKTKLDAFLDEPLLERYRPDPGPFSRGIVTCTGAEFCSYGVVETKTRGLRWARELDQWVERSDHVDSSALPDAIRIHMSGCSASCAQPQVGDFGLRGERYRDDSEEVPAADLGIGSDLSRGEFIDWVAGSVPLTDIPDAIRRTVVAFEQDSRATESFADWTGRQSVADLAALVRGQNDTRAPAGEVS